jgi:hypothetical protein
MSTTMTLPNSKLSADAELRAELEKLRAENSKMKAEAAAKVVLKVSVKGAVSLYGIQKQFPITLYRNQWVRVLDMADAIRAFCAMPDDKFDVLQNEAYIKAIAKEKEKAAAQPTA